MIKFHPSIEGGIKGELRKVSVFTEYKYRGARAVVILHEQQMREFVATWKRAMAVGLELPKTDDRDYASMESVLRHVMQSARGYMTWICEKLKLPDPQIEPPPEADMIAERVDDYLEHLLDKWKYPLVDLDKIKFFQPIYESRWKVNYCVEAMLEHAVVHPLRHSIQLEELMKKPQ